MPSDLPVTGTVTQVASSATVVTIRAANTSRRALSLYNDSTAVLYLKLGGAASTASYSIQIPAGGYYELQPIASIGPWAPGEKIGGCYEGIITGLWASANGNAYVTEIT